MLRGFLRLPAGDKVALLRTVATLALIRLTLTVLPGDRLARALGIPLQLSPEAAAPAATLDTIPERHRREIRMLDLLLRHRPSRTRCLERSLTIAVILRDSHPRLRIGVARAAGEIQAHAWVEAGGCSFLANRVFLPLGLPAGQESR